MASEHWKTGIELELMAPLGLSRLSLAQALADDCGGRVLNFFHPQAEHSASQQNPVFQNLTQGFRVVDSDGHAIADLVDDLTLQQDCNKQHPPKEGWYRVVSNDSRLLNLVQAQCNPQATAAELLQPIAQLFGTKPQLKDNMIRVADKDDAAIAMLAPLPGERERPCEIVSAPIASDLAGKLTRLLRPASQLGFTLAAEAATHFHFDAEKLQSGRVLARLIGLFHEFSAELRKTLHTNPLNRRLAAMPDELVGLATDAHFIAADWELAQQMLKECKHGKFQDVNFMNIATGNSSKHTLEVRMAGPSMDVTWLVQQFHLLEGILRWSLGDAAMPHHLSDL